MHRLDLVRGLAVHDAHIAPQLVGLILQHARDGRGERAVLGHVAHVIVARAQLLIGDARQFGQVDGRMVGMIELEQVLVARRMMVDVGVHAEIHEVEPCARSHLVGHLAQHKLRGLLAMHVHRLVEAEQELHRGHGSLVAYAADGIAHLVAIEA